MVDGHLDQSRPKARSARTKEKKTPGTRKKTGGGCDCVARDTGGVCEPEDGPGVSTGLEHSYQKSGTAII